MVSFYTRVIATGRTSITAEVGVITFREDEMRTMVMVTDAIVTYVAIDEARKPCSIRIRKSAIDPPAFSPEYLQQKLRVK